MQRELTVSSERQYQVIDLTADVARVVADSGLTEGLCHVYVPHATAAVVINENDDPNLCDDLLDALDRLVPEGQWRHDRIDATAPRTSRPRCSVRARWCRCATRACSSVPGRRSCSSTSTARGSAA